MILNIISVVGFIIGLIGFYLTIDSLKKNKALKSVSWNEIQNATRFIWKKLKGDNFVPDIIISPDPKGGIIAHILAEYYDNKVIILIGYAELSRNNSSGLVSDDNFTVISTNKWKVRLPTAVESIKPKEKIKILIVDDFVLSGDFNKHMYESLITLGYNRTNIKDCCVAVTQVAISAKKEPKYYWKIVLDSDFDFPWGKAE